ncbi:MAG TPA: roadblock/LC7 domain-containing protein [Methanoregula sp.]|nr:roadblock/LC7 domain-containing protein [Methanoregula sp.]
MKLPAGTDGGTITNPQEEGLMQYLMDFRGAIEIDTPSGHGFIITENGNLVAAYFRNGEGAFRGKSALTHMITESGDGTDAPQSFTLRKYSVAEFSQAVEVSREENLLISVPPSAGEQAPEKGPAAEKAVSRVPALLDEEKLRKIVSQPGVIAVSAFFEGFPVQSIGQADFEHVAALAEDLMRAGTKIAQEMKIGVPDQLILETAGNKLIIAPCGDLFLCVFTTSDAQLGMIRVVLRSIQQEIAG